MNELGNIQSKTPTPYKNPIRAQQPKPPYTTTPTAHLYAMVVALRSSQRQRQSLLMASAWLSSVAFKNKSPSSPPTNLGILSFETAKIMSRLLSLYNSLSDHQIHRLRTHTISSSGVSYLNSPDEWFLMNLAFHERLDDLNHAAAAVSRLASRCSHLRLKHFGLLYAEYKNNRVTQIHHKFQFGSKCAGKLIEKMKRFVSLTANLSTALESVSQLEQSKKRVERWNSNLDPKHCLEQSMNFEPLNQKLASQRKQVHYYKKVSLWNQSFDKSVGLMARIVCTIYTRLCVVFAPYIADLPENNSIPHKPTLQSFCLLEDREFYLKKNKATSKSGPIKKTSQKTIVRFPSRLPENIGLDVREKENRVYRFAPKSTVGACGLTLRYADVIVFAERCLYAPGTIGENARHSLYEMLPEKLKEMVRRKLKGQWGRKRKVEEEEEEADEAMAEGWRKALEEIMEWMTPLAHDTLKWQSERSLMEKQHRFDADPTVLLLQTLHYSDLDKTETAIAEVLVGLSCIFKYEHKRNLRGQLISCR